MNKMTTHKPIIPRKLALSFGWIEPSTGGAIEMAVEGKRKFSQQRRRTAWNIIPNSPHGESGWALRRTTPPSNHQVIT
jgi:hypothetical protein